MAHTKKIKEIDFEEELARNIFVVYTNSTAVHRRRSNNYKSSRAFTTPYCADKSNNLSSFYKKGTQLSDICKECLRSYSKDEIEALKHFLVVQKLKGK